MNVHDSEKLSGILNQMGYSACDKEQQADVILLNTCSVREKAYQKVFSYLGQIKPLKMKNPDLVIGVCGCHEHQHNNDIVGAAINGCEGVLVPRCTSVVCGIVVEQGLSVIRQPSKTCRRNVIIRIRILHSRPHAIDI